MAQDLEDRPLSALLSHENLRAHLIAVGALDTEQRTTAHSATVAEQVLVRNELDEFEIEKCGGQKMKRRLKDGGRDTDPALKDAGPRALEGVGQNGHVQSRP